MFHPVERRNVSEAALNCFLALSDRRLCWTGLGVTLFLSFTFSGAGGPQAFQQIQQNEKDCLHWYVCGLELS